jgi:hypothetical protein
VGTVHLPYPNTVNRSCSRSTYSCLQPVSTRTKPSRSCSTVNPTPVYGRYVRGKLIHSVHLYSTGWRRPSARRFGRISDNRGMGVTKILSESTNFHSDLIRLRPNAAMAVRTLRHLASFMYETQRKPSILSIGPDVGYTGPEAASGLEPPLDKERHQFRPIMRIEYNQLGETSQTLLALLWFALMSVLIWARGWERLLSALNAIKDKARVYLGLRPK